MSMIFILIDYFTVVIAALCGDDDYTPVGYIAPSFDRSLSVGYNFAALCKIP